MPDNLRDRIAEALEAEGAPPSKSDMWADAVIEALELEVTVTAKASDGSFRSFAIEGYWEERDTPAE